MDKSLFYQNFQNSSDIEEFLSKLKEYALKNISGSSVYVINKPLGKKNYFYELW